MAHGSPDSLDEMEAYLLHIRGGRPTSPALIDEMRRRYALVGGRSPLLDITRAQAQALEACLNRAPSGPPWRVYVGMRHWHPFIHETVATLRAEGADQIVALCLAPHYSRLSIGAYFARLREALDAQQVSAPVQYIESWHTEPGLIQAITEKVIAGIDRLPADRREALQIVFTAHSLPVAAIQQGDPYEQQLNETARLVAERLSLQPGSWQFCYQSAGASSVPWLGPDIQDVITGLASADTRTILVVPIGFVADHVEVLYDLDIEARAVADHAGVLLARTESLNTTPRFIEALAEIVQRAAQTP